MKRISLKTTVVLISLLAGTSLTGIVWAEGKAQPASAPAPQQAAKPSASAVAKTSIQAEADKIADELGLTLEQREKMKALTDDFSAKEKATTAGLKAKRDALKNELDNDVLDKAKVDAIVGEIKALQASLLENRVDQTVKMHQLLTPEQYKKLKEIREKRHAERMAANAKAKAPAKGKDKK
ncbi:MAG: Spy/CpxP family protein refolding chaperone [Candidatus Omnitrophica bacterium]|nr:Spy/CpxP family protein refolding chaperone [Candidatus Omnitrophota bacterium]